MCGTINPRHTYDEYLVWHKNRVWPEVDLQRAFSSRRFNGSTIGVCRRFWRRAFACDGFSLSETIRFVNLEFIADRFDDLSLSPLGDGSGTVIMGPACGGPPLLQRTMVGDPTEGFCHTPKF
jgi:hypothetical protein